MTVSITENLKIAPFQEPTAEILGWRIVTATKQFSRRTT